jgi:lactate dehydrogenase-like 2-hydroxyacid dehydrogenase
MKIAVLNAESAYAASEFEHLTARLSSASLRSAAAKAWASLGACSGWVSTMVARADYVVLCIPATPVNENIIDATTLASMKRGAPTNRRMIVE